MSTVAILSYHKIGPPAPDGWESWYYIPEEIFTAQLKTLRSRGFEFIDLATFYLGLEDPSKLPGKSALVTFDDAYRNIRTVALPAMQKLGNVPGVVFVPTKYIGGMNTWDQDVEPPDAICNWDDLLALERGGVAVESHSVSHPAFSDLTPQQHEAELRQSKETLEEKLNRRVEFFAYPYGDAGKDAAVSERLLRDLGYRAACLYGGGCVTLPGVDRYRLERFAMGPDTDLSNL